jgi:hypothetical protein
MSAGLTVKATLIGGRTRSTKWTLYPKKPKYHWYHLNFMGDVFCPVSFSSNKDYSQLNICSSGLACRVLI